MDDSEIAFDERGLVPCVVQDWRTGEVLTLAYMNDAALRRTRETGEVHFFSRSRNALWHKGETSGNTLKSKRSATTATETRCSPWSSQVGPACHTGERTCFHRGELEPAAPHEALPTLERTIARGRKRDPTAPTPPHYSKTRRGSGAKVLEEAEELVRAAREESQERVSEEAADILYHMAVLLRGRELSLTEAERVLDGRRKR